MRELVALLVLSCSISVFAHKTDSIGTKVKNDKIYILHKVEKGDGLYSISKKYNVKLKDIVNENPGAEKVVKLGQTILVPTGRKAVLEQKVVKDYFDGKSVKDQPMPSDNSKTTEVTTFAKYHKVSKGETLYSISRKYKTSVEMIKTLNSLSSDVLSEGQRILVQDGEAKTSNVEKNKQVETDYTKMKEKMDKENYTDLGFESELNVQSEKNSSGYSKKVEKFVEYDIEKIEETGTMTIGASRIPDDKNFAYHFEAPIGTVIMVTNPQTKNSVFVKVIGNFSRPSESAVIIKLSKSSAKQIGVESKGSVMLSYGR